MTVCSCSLCGVMLLDDEIEESQKQGLIHMCYDCMDEMVDDDNRSYYEAKNSSNSSNNS
jgi:hypothetical protein